LHAKANPDHNISRDPGFYGGRSVEYRKYRLLHIGGNNRTKIANYALHQYMYRIEQYM